MLTQKNEIPDNSILRKDSNLFTYVDSYQAIISREDIDIKYIAHLFFTSRSKWVDRLMLIRNTIVKPLGLKTSDDITDVQEDVNSLEYEVGKRIGIFKILDKTDNEIILGEDDSHLNFRVSLLLDASAGNIEKKELSITTAVQFNNIIGKLYFIPVKPFHKIIVKSMTKNILQQIASKN